MFFRGREGLFCISFYVVQKVARRLELDSPPTPARQLERRAGLGQLLLDLDFSIFSGTYLQKICK
jgi:hypothetical protein